MASMAARSSSLNGFAISLLIAHLRYRAIKPRKRAIIKAMFSIKIAHLPRLVAHFPSIPLPTFNHGSWLKVLSRRSWLQERRASETAFLRENVHEAVGPCCACEDDRCSPIPHCDQRQDRAALPTAINSRRQSCDGPLL